MFVWLCGQGLLPDPPQADLQAYADPRNPTPRGFAGHDVSAREERSNGQENRYQWNEPTGEAP